jgi:PAB-dependent poly(A)-specific ribonuclease subunit 2
LKKGKYICAATQNGTVNMLDTTSFDVLKTWKPHSAGISAMDTGDDFIVTCGYVFRLGQYARDSFLPVFDMKKMASINPISFPALGAFVRMHPRMSTTSIATSHDGQIQVIDLMNPQALGTTVKQINIPQHCTVTEFEISPSGEAVAIADSMFQIHLWGSPGKLKFVTFPTATEFGAPVEPLPAIDWSNEP